MARGSGPPVLWALASDMVAAHDIAWGHCKSGAVADRSLHRFPKQPGVGVARRERRRCLAHQ